jgi:LuxR family transcriptional regulator, maltose regulon positive regulatory protein
MSAVPVLRPAPAPRLRIGADGALRLAGAETLPRPAQRLLRGAAVRRPRLVDPLLDDARALVALTAPAGFGKSMLLAEWCAAEARRCAWVSLTHANDDRGALIDVITAALAVTGPGRAPFASARSLDRLLQAFDACGPVVLVLDDVHVLRSRAACDVVRRLAVCVPPGCTLALASRLAPPVPIDRLRAGDDVAELGPRALALSGAEARRLLDRTVPGLTPPERERLVALAAGWPAALALAAHALAEQDDLSAAVAAFGGDDGALAGYVRDEVLTDLDPGDRAFLRRTSILEPLDGPACDAVLGRDDSAGVLRRLADATGLLVAVDRAGTAFRHHPLIGQALRSELRTIEPHTAARLHARASVWHEHEGDIERAGRHAVAVRDADRLAALLADRAPAFAAAGRAAVVEEWLGRLPRDAIAARPGLALAAAVVRLVQGDRDAAEQWAAHAASGGDPAGLAVVRAGVARHGHADMTRAAALAADAAAEHSTWRAFACMLGGAGLWLGGDRRDAVSLLEEGARRAVLDAPLVRSLCLAQLGLLESLSGDRHQAGVLAARARRAVDGIAHPVPPLAALTFAISALSLADDGRLGEGRAAMARAETGLRLLPDVAPWYGAAARIALACAELRLSDAAAARRLLGDAARLLRRSPAYPALHAWLDDAWSRCDDYADGPAACRSALTLAELRVLRFLPSHLTFREIAALLHVSANTVKTQAHAVYRKLDASSRSEAVAHARTLGLVDA